MLHWIKGELYAKNQGPDSREKKGISLLSNFRARQTDIVAYRGFLFNLGFIGSKEDCMPKIKGLNKEIRKI